MAYLEEHRSLNERFARWLELSEDAATRVVASAVALHDIGKCASAFQVKRADAAAQLGMIFKGNEGLVDCHHASLTLPIYDAALGTDASSESSRFRQLLVPVSGHHGRPVSSIHGQHLRGNALIEGLRRSRFAQPWDIDAARALVDIVVQTLGPPRDDHDFIVPAECTWAIAGLTVLADWIGSNELWFPPIAEAGAPEAYWRQAYERARHAIQNAGVVVVEPSAFTSAAMWIASGQQIRPMQSAAASVELGDGPTITILEDLTGSGKTEAAMILAHRMIAAGRAARLFWALPTQATATAMYDRLRRRWSTLFSADSNASVVLAHGRADTNAAFLESRVWPADDRSPPHDDEDGAAQCRAWIADSRKKALLAHIGIGTIDQVLLAALKSRHQQLRLLGLVDAVLVVDEVHAADAYQTAILERVLHFQAALGGDAVLLSATLPVATREKLIAAFERGLDDRHHVAPPIPAPTREYPALIRVGRGLVHAAGVEAVGLREHRIVRHDAVAAADEVAIASASTGQAVLYIRNTVRDAIETYRRVRNRSDGVRVSLFHARFTAGDRATIEDGIVSRFGPRSRGEQRQGAIVVATQVAEASLDIDFDVLISDLAPIDVLIQRMGRLRRHSRTSSGDPVNGPDERGPAYLHLISAATAEPKIDWLRDLLPSTLRVYESRLHLWRTAAVLPDGHLVKLPSDARAMVEFVYDEDGEVPPAFVNNDIMTIGDRSADQFLGRANSLDPNRPYPPSGEGLWDDDERAPTRLGERSEVLRICVRALDGALHPLARPEPGDERNAMNVWRRSEVSVRRSLLARSGEAIEPVADVMLERLRSTWPDQGRWVVPLVVAETGAGSYAGTLRAGGSDVRLVYSADEGLIRE